MPDQTARAQPIQAVVFDPYGTLFDACPVASVAGGRLPLTENPP